MWYVSFAFLTLAAVAALYFFYDLWAFEDDHDRTKKNVARHIAVMLLLSIAWPLTWLVPALILGLGDWDSFIAWYSEEVSTKLNGG